MDQPATLTSQRSGSSASIARISRPSPSCVMPSGPISSSTARRTATAQSSPTASFVSSMSSRRNRTRLVERAAVLVGAVVVPAREQLHRQRQAVGGVAVDDVEPGVARAQCRGAVPPAYVGEVALGHRPRLHRLEPAAAQHALGARSDRRHARVVVGGVEAGVGELDARERSVLVHRVGHEAQPRHVRVVPQPALDVGRQVGGRVDLDLLGAHHAPAALGLDAAHRGQRRGTHVAEAVAVRHLVEAVRCRDRDRCAPVRTARRSGWRRGRRTCREGSAAARHRS